MYAWVSLKKYIFRGFMSSYSAQDVNSIFIKFL
jgi:hypothetical protein